MSWEVLIVICSIVSVVALVAMVVLGIVYDKNRASYVCAAISLIGLAATIGLIFSYR